MIKMFQKFRYSQRKGSPQKQKIGENSSQGFIKAVH